MAGPNDDVLLSLGVVSKGVEEITKAQAQIVALQQKAVELQKQQAAAATAQAASLNTLSKSFATAETNVGNLTDEVTGFTHGLGAIPGVMDLARTAIDLGRRSLDAFSDVIRTGGDMEAWEASFEVLLGGADKAKAHLKDLADFAAHTPFELPQVIEASKLLESLGLNTKTYLGTLGNVASFMDRDLKDAVLALGNAQRGEFENLKTFGVDISEIMVRAGVKLNSSAKRTTEENHRIVDALIGYWDEKFGGGMEKIAATTNGRLSNISDAWFQFKLRIAQSGVGDVFREQLNKVLEKIDELDKNGTLEKWAKQVSGAMTSVLTTAQYLFENLEKLRGPLEFLAGGIGLARIGAMATAAAGAFATWGLQVTAATTAAEGFTIATAAMGGPLGVALFLIGGIAAISYANAQQHVETLTEKYSRLNDQLDEASRKAPAAAPELKELIGQAEQARDRVKKLQAERDRLDQSSPIALIDRQQIRDLDEAIGKASKLADELERARRGGIDREAPIAGPVGLIASARAQLDESFGRRTGASLGDLLAGAPVPTAATSTPKTPFDPAAAKKAADERFKLAGEAVKLEQDTASKLADIVAKGVQERIELAAREPEERLRLLEQFEQDALGRSIALEQERTRQLAAIEERRQSQLAAIASTPTDSATRARLTADVDARAAAERAALERSVRDGTFLVAFERQLGDQRIALAKEVAASREAEWKKEQDAAEASVLAVVKFELALRRESAETLAHEYERRLQTVRKGSDEEIALTAKLRAALGLVTDETKALNDELEKFALIGVSTARALELHKKGITAEDVGAVSSATGLEGDAAARVTEAAKANDALDKMIEHAAAATAQMRDLFTLFFQDLGLGWDLAAEAGSVAFAGMAAAGNAAYNTLEKAAAEWFKHHRGVHALGLQILKAAAKEGAAASLDAIAQVTKAEALEAEGLALKALAQGILGDPRGFAAAAKYQLAAFALGGISAIAAGGAESLRSSAQEDQAQGSNAALDAAGTGRTGDTTRRLSVAGNAPITQNFNVSVNFFGGLNLFGPDAAIALLREMKPYLQQMLTDRELTVPTGNA